MKRASSSEEFQSDILNADVTFHWIAGTERFWFKRQTHAGDECVVVDARTGEQSLVSAEPVMPADALRPDWVFSPDRCYPSGRHENDLWLRDLSNGREQRITLAGEANFGYGDVDPCTIVSRLRVGGS